MRLFYILSLVSCTILPLHQKSFADPLLAESLAPLPPNWSSGGGATVEKLHSARAQKKMASPENESEFSSDKVKSNRHMVGAFAALPELARLDYRYSLSPFLTLTLGAAGPMPVEVDVAMPSDVIKADTQKGLAVAYPSFDIKFKIDWGPHVYAGAVWHPFGGNWYSSAALGVRSIRIRGSAVSPLRICSIAEAAKEPPCADDTAAIQTRSQLSLKTDITLLSYTARAATGWTFSLSPAWTIMIEAGLFVPLKTSNKTKVKAELISPDGDPAELSGALADLRAKSETDVAAKAKTELGKYTQRALPVLGLGLGYRF
jgi:hypothetical protein